LININDLGLQRPTWAEINLDILHSNYVEARNAVAPARVLAVVKSDGYGHGAVAVARELEKAGVECFGTATALEAVELRDAGIQTPIVLLSGMAPSQIPLLLKYQFIPAVYNFEFLHALKEFVESHRQQVSVHIKVDTGMGRLGFTPEDAARAFDLTGPNIRIDGLFTHFANADVSDDPYTKAQLDRFLDFVRRHNKQVRYLHAANSAAVINYPESHLDLVRPGILLYGVSPFPDRPIPQKPILSLKSKIVSLHTISKGDTIGYGRNFTAGRESIIATIPFGYADGLRRALSNRLEVEICSTMCRIAGNISMDLCMADVTDIADRVKIYDTVTFLGPRTICWDWAKLLRTLPYEITCLIGARVPRVYYKAGQLHDIYYP